MRARISQPTIRDQISTFAAMVRKEITILSRYPVNFLASFGQIFLIVAIFTLAGLTFSPTGQGNAVVSGLVVYGFVLFIFLSDTLWTIGYNVREEQVQGTLEQLYLSPANKFASLVARVSHLLIWTSLVNFTGVLVMRALLGALPVENPGLGLYILTMSLLGTFGFGFAFAAVTLHLRETAQTLLNFLQFSFMILSAMFFPFSILPDSVLFLSRLIPFSYAVDAFRSTLMGYPAGFPELAPIEVELIIITLFGLLMPLVGFYLYRRAELAARRRGSLSEY